jgi:hypothetical protein
MLRLVLNLDALIFLWPIIVIAIPPEASNPPAMTSPAPKVL